MTFDVAQVSPERRQGAESGTSGIDRHRAVLHTIPLNVSFRRGLNPEVLRPITAVCNSGVGRSGAATSSWSCRSTKTNRASRWWSSSTATRRTFRFRKSLRSTSFKTTWKTCWFTRAGSFRPACRSAARSAIADSFRAPRTIAGAGGPTRSARSTSLRSLSLSLVARDVPRDAPARIDRR